MADQLIYTDVNSAIIERCKKGERKAFYELYSLYAKAMFNISLRILNNTAEAEEVLQDSFLKAFEKIGSYNPEYSFGAWLKRIVINGSLDVFKKRKLVLLSLDGLQYAQEEDNEDTIDYDIETIKNA